MNQKINVSNVEKQQKVDVENKQTITTTIEQTGKSPYVGENGNWFQYDDKQSLFVDTGVKVQGESGKNATINGLEGINIIGGENIDLVQQGNDFYINYNGTQMNVEVVEELPSEGVSGKIYLILKETNTNNDIYDEYLYINGIWEHIGSTAVNLTDYYTKNEVNELLKNIDVDLPVATADILGGIKVGETLNIGEDGTLNTLPSIIWINQNNITDYFEKEGSNYYIYMDEVPKRVVFMFDRALSYASSYLKGGKVYARPDRKHTSIQASLTFNANAMCFWVDEYTESSTYYNNSINIISPGEPISRVCYYFYLTSWQNRSADVLIDRDTAQEIKGIKTFTALPKSTITPTDNAHLVNKAYVDAQIGAVNEILATLTTVSEVE